MTYYLIPEQTVFSHLLLYQPAHHRQGKGLKNNPDRS